MTVPGAFGVEIEGPWFTPDKWVSPFYWGADVQSAISPPEKVLIHDVTLRDGEQAARVVFTPEEKILMARELDKLGVHSIEPGFPTSAQDVEVLHELVGAGLKSKIVPIARIKSQDVRACIDAKPHGVLLEMGINPFLLREIFNTTLTPDYDRFHRNHIHIDASPKKEGDAKFCGIKGRFAPGSVPAFARYKMPGKKKWKATGKKHPAKKRIRAKKRA